MLVGGVIAGLRRTKGRHFDRLGSHMDMDETEPAPDHERPSEERLDLFGPRVGRDVEVLRLDAEQQVAHRASDNERLEARLLEASGYLQRTPGKLVPPDRVVRGPVDAWAAPPRAAG